MSETLLTAFIAAYDQDDLHICPINFITQFLDDRTLSFITSKFLGPDTIPDIKKMLIKNGVIYMPLK